MPEWVWPPGPGAKRTPEQIEVDKLRRKTDALEAELALANSTS